MDCGILWPSALLIVHAHRFGEKKLTQSPLLANLHTLFSNKLIYVARLPFINVHLEGLTSRCKCKHSCLSSPEGHICRGCMLSQSADHNLHFSIFGAFSPSLLPTFRQMALYLRRVTQLFQSNLEAVTDCFRIALERFFRGPLEPFARMRSVSGHTGAQRLPVFERRVPSLCRVRLEQACSLV